MKVWSFISVLLLASCGWAHTRTAPLPVVEQVDLDRYLGTWFEIARLPNRFEEGCEAITATYTLRDDGTIGVLNRCRVGSPSGPEKRASGRARVVDPETGAKLAVSFFGPFYGDYWIIALDDDYQYAVVGEPRRKYLWVLAREPTLAPDVYERLMRTAEELGFDTSRLVMPDHGVPGTG